MRTEKERFFMKMEFGISFILFILFGILGFLSLFSIIDFTIIDLFLSKTPFVFFYIELKTFNNLLIFFLILFGLFAILKTMHGLIGEVINFVMTILFILLFLSPFGMIQLNLFILIITLNIKWYIVIQISYNSLQFIMYLVYYFSPDEEEQYFESSLFSSQSPNVFEIEADEKQLKEIIKSLR